MNFVQVFSLILAIVLIGVAATENAEHDHHDHGTSHVKLSQKHKHGEHKFTYDIKHGKHGSAHGSAYPHGYGGFGSS
ncbi:Hypothetical protein NTJ_05918 [Nesidiocoris tenuis]|uniref:Uncharacterized protein n=1 Tax=Nesidiocoris tenuis TaxID=355587 RepID=A0ABN7ANV6_9HEMI|nr:Hypothetical protein NTJ_05918 [Nesidiocoris tenuis]